jgi:NAD-dependent DNA ligase
MSQKSVFERIYNIVLTRGGKRAIDAISSMYDSYVQLNSDDQLKQEDAAFVKNQLIEAFIEADIYRSDIASRGFSSTGIDKEFNERQRISKEYLKQDLTSVKNDSTIFYNKRVVVTGVFSRYPVRDDLAVMLKELGADINGSVSKKTDIVCLGGVGVGPAKLAKIEELKNEGFDIQLVNEIELYSIIDNL